LDASAAGHVQRRITELDLANQALILAALAFVLLVPVLVRRAALVPLGGGASGAPAQRVGPVGWVGAAGHGLGAHAPAGRGRAAADDPVGVVDSAPGAVVGVA
jgi:hypothetical protein